MLRLVLCLICCSFPASAMTFSSDQASFSKSFDDRGMIVTIQNRVNEDLLCHVRYLQDKVWLVIPPAGQSQPLLLPKAKYYEGSFACRPYEGRKEPGKMWRVQPFRYGIPTKNKIIKVL
ncbi:hypothetical protein [Motilimonas eburnea]|uniref:hypothetical protein n=1 Tax=Motilimonas eburnea TaxID=1737488 RepID=UPI001E523597|nr:hypothetical protein [Motilimonas eburnea]MCE2572902.1 hypothetical protein [Motilimonas eburnea]